MVARNIRFHLLPIGLSIALTSRRLNFNLWSMSSERIFINDLHSLEWLGILVARVAVGLLFFLSGRSKLFLPERRDQMRQTLIEARVPFPDINAVFISIVEFVCGLLLWRPDERGITTGRQIRLPMASHRRFHIAA